MKVNEIIHTMPKVVRDLLIEGANSPERLDFHPEATLGNHIQIVAHRAILSGNTTLLFIALLHDMCKHQMPNKSKGGLVDKGDFVYWTNPDHAFQASDMIRDSKDIQNWIESFECDWVIVDSVVRKHMWFKNYKSNMREGKKANFRKECPVDVFYLLEEFNLIDTMNMPYKEFTWEESLSINNPKLL